MSKLSNEKENGASEIMFMEPVFTHNIWGGSSMAKEFGYDVKGNDIGECWGIAAHPSGDATVRNGRFSGMKLSEVWDKHPEVFGNTSGDRFPLLVKIISAATDLSIQVHPDDEYAALHEEGSLGKMECWYIIDCQKDSKLVVGHNAENRMELCDMIDQGRWDELIREIPVRPGDFIQIDPGTVHAIKGGITLLETQQNSDITYRLYDYGRLQDGKPRQLHLEQSKAVITVPALPAEASVMHDNTKLDDVKSSGNNMSECIKKLASCHYYSVYRLNVNGRLRYEQSSPFVLMTVIRGNGMINGSEIKKGDFFILPGGMGNVELEGKMQIIASATVKIKAFEE